MPAKKLEVSEQDLCILRVYTYKGIRIPVVIDFEKERISLVRKDATNDKWQPAHYVFSGREVVYMKGWKLILAALEYAVDHAEDVLQAHLDNKTKDFATLLYQIQHEKSLKLPGRKI